MVLGQLDIHMQKNEVGLPPTHTPHIIIKESEVAQLCPTLCDPMDCSLPGFSVHRILQARVLEWGAIAFSKLSTE